MAGLVLGLASMILGALLILFGAVGSTRFLANALGTKLEMTDAPPGVVLFAIGLFALLFTRYKIKIG